MNKVSTLYRKNYPKYTENLGFVAAICGMLKTKQDFAKSRRNKSSTTILRLTVKIKR